MRSDHEMTIGRISRRHLLQGAASLALGGLVTGCGGGDTALRVRLLHRSLPQQLVGDFQRTLAERVGVEVRPERSLQAIATLIEQWQAIAQGDVAPLPNWRRWVPFVEKPVAPVAHLVTLGDAWLAGAIQAGAIAPLALEELDHWPQLPARWQALVRRDDQGDLAATGQLWGAPYRWGTTAIAYDRTQFAKLGWEPQDWADLWRPELRERVAVVDQPREVIGFTLKKLGHSYNTPDLEAIPELAAELQALQPQIRLYNSVDYLQPLLLKDVWVAVGWSPDLLAAQSRYPQIVTVVPPSGTALWADVWVQPAAARGDRDLAQRWIDFCWQGRAAQKISRFSEGISPLLWEVERASLPEVLRSPSARFPAADLLDRSEFLEPLTATTQVQYETLWRELRGGAT